MQPAGQLETGSDCKMFVASTPWCEVDLRVDGCLPSLAVCSINDCGLHACLPVQRCHGASSTKWQNSSVSGRRDASGPRHWPAQRSLGLRVQLKSSETHLVLRVGKERTWLVRAVHASCLRARRFLEVSRRQLQRKQQTRSKKAPRNDGGMSQTVRSSNGS